MDQIKVVHVLFVPVLLLPLPAEAQGGKLLLRLFLLRLPRHAVLCTELQLPKGPFVQRLLQPKLLHLHPSQLQLQAVLRRPLPAAVQRRLLLLRGVLRLRRLPRRPRPVPVVVLQRPAAAFLLQVPVVVLRGGDVLWRQGGVLPRLVPRRPGGGAVPGVLMRLRVLLSPVQRRVPVPAVR